MIDYAHLRLKDRIRPGVRVLFVGINPGVRSALTGHHFAGPSNNFWKLLFESGLTPERVTHVDDDRLPEWGYGMTNIVARPTPGVSDLTLTELRAGRAALERKVRRYKPAIVALVGITVYRALFPVGRSVSSGRITPGRTRDRIGDAVVWVLPNPSGRNAHYSYREMVAAFRALARACRTR
ncbi:MAG TPA: mismatch-specific DNA-glycosylase [Vicinamibacterales bacterium]|nr:mismatch-specific DNA-glycosylase [Vicinamibacterales bacterium]